MPDRERKDGTTRDRVDEIAAAMDAYRGRMDARYRRVAWLMIACAVATLLLVPIGYFSLQGQRLRQSRQACLIRNEQSDATVRLLLELQVRPGVVSTARATFPREDDCEAYARGSVGGWTLFGGDGVVTPPPPSAR